MNNLSNTAERLRAAHRAEDRFLALFAVECLCAHSRAFDRLARDIASFQGDGCGGDEFTHRSRLGDD